uniref:winged helix-turn-helix transcriptional regulator n=1 Tax=Campylobacter concisus TaxID=199 RepID=UPI000CD82E43
SILYHLGNKTMRTGEPRRLILNISQKVLTAGLRDLEKDEIIVRKVYNEVPLRIKYSLSPRGKNLRKILLLMSDFGEKIIKNRVQNGEKVEVVSKNNDGFKEQI